MSSYSSDHAFYCGDTSVMITRRKKIICGSNDDVLRTENLKIVSGEHYLLSE